MPHPRQRRVLLVSAIDAPFIDEDAEILAGEFAVTRATGSGPAALLRALRGVPSADIVYCWFLSVYGAVAVLAAKLAGRRAVVVLGGVDVARDPESGYGLWVSPWKAFIARRALRSADLVLAVAESLRDAAVLLGRYDGGNIRYLPTGYDPEFWTPGPGGEPRVLCVASVTDRARLGVKGIDILVEAARLEPGIPMAIVGVDERFVGGLKAPSNIVFHPRVPRKELREWYRRAKVYCQPSRREGLPNALCEAMLCGCIPVAAGVGGIPPAIGEAGFVVPPGDPAALAAVLRKAIDAPAATGEEARRRIIALFPLERRKSELPGLLRNLNPSITP
jgi:glycosyltransferase involved in cell wall biosynthesis